MSKFSHIDEQGRAQMVDISAKTDTVREAVAEACLSMKPETLSELLSGTVKKGDVFATARIAGIQAAKKCSDIIPLCHPLMLSHVQVTFEPLTETNRLLVQSRCRLVGQTGVEMEALTAASVAALTIYDMCKALEKGIVIENVRLLEKTGGKSGNFKSNK